MDESLERFECRDYEWRWLNVVSAYTPQGGFLSDLDEVVESVSEGTQRKKKMTCTKSLCREIELERICSKLVFLRIDMKKVKVVC